MAPFYPYIVPQLQPTTTAVFPSSTAPRASITSDAEVHASPCPYHQNITMSSRNSTHHAHSQSSKAIHTLSYPYSTARPTYYHPTPTPACNTCEPPLLPDGPTRLPILVCDGCEAPRLPGNFPRSLVTNVTTSGLPALSQAEASSSPGSGYHSNATGKVLMVVLMAAGAAVALGAVYGIGRACWKWKSRTVWQEESAKRPASSPA